MSPSDDRLGSEHSIEVPKTARFWSLGPPDASDIWIVLHGYGQLADRFLRRFEPIDDGTRRIVAPEALSRFYVRSEQGRHGAGSLVGATWMTREARQDDIRDYIRYLDLLGDRVLASASVQNPSLTVLGFSQGVATAARWCAESRVRPDRLIFWGDFLPPDLDLDAARARWPGVELVTVRGEGDATIQTAALAEADADRINALGLPFRHIRYAGGHDIHPETLRALAPGECGLPGRDR